MSGRLAVLVALALTACGGSKASGAAALAAYGMVGSAFSRSAGGCFAVCDANQVCNPESGFCESNPCGPGCGSSRRCDTRGPVPRCVDDSLPADLVRTPPPPPSVPAAAPIP